MDRNVLEYKRPESQDPPLPTDAMAISILGICFGLITVMCRLTGMNYNWAWASIRIAGVWQIYMYSLITQIIFTVLGFSLLLYFFHGHQHC